MESLLPGGHLVQHCPKGEQVSSTVQVLSFYLFRRHVSDRTKHRTWISQMFFRLECSNRRIRSRNRSWRELSQAKIKDFGVPTISNKDVGGLNVSMNNSFRVGGIERIGDFDSERE